MSFLLKLGAGKQVLVKNSSNKKST